MNFIKKWLDQRKAKRIAKQLYTQQYHKKIHKQEKLARRRKSELTIDQLKAIISKEAYALAQKSGFNPDLDKENWIEAERKVLKKVKLSKLI
ncbi:MAG: DUF2934 domain-containing protein [bacterium]